MRNFIYAPIRNNTKGLFHLMKSLITLLLILSLTNCKPNAFTNFASDLPKSFSLSRAFSNKGELNLSDIASNIQYIKLETNKENLIGVIHKLHITEKYIYVMEFMGESVFCFTHEGKFVSRISREGKGPGEFYNVLAINGPLGSNNIFLVDELKKLIEFNPNGEYIQTLNYSFGAFDLAFLDNIPVLYIPGRSADPKNYPVLVSLEKRKSSILLNRPDHMEDIIQVIGPHSIYFGDFGIRLWEQFNDTILTITSNGVFPTYVFTPTNNRIPKESYHNPVEWEELWKTKDLVYKVFETENFFFLNARSKGIQKKLIIDKISSDGFTLKKDITNDLDSGLDFWPDGVELNGSKLYQVKDSYKLYKMKEELQKNGEFQKLPNDGFKAILNRTDGNDNPVIILLSLKK